MATILDLGLIQYFDPIFAVLLVFGIIYSLLQKTGAITKSIAINAVIAFAISFMVLLSDTLIQVINFIIPWFVIVIIFTVLLLLIFQMLGAQEADFLAALKKDNLLMWAVLGVGIVIMVAAFGNVLGQSLLEEAGESGSATIGEGNVASGSFQQNIYATLFNPKVLGILVLFGVAIFAILLLSGSSN